MAVGNDVVGRLAEVDVVVGVHQLRPTSPPRISVARLAMTSLALVLVDVPEPVWKMSRELVVEVALHHLVGRGADGLGDVVGESPRRPNGGRRPLEETERPDDPPAESRSPEIGKLSTARWVEAP
jgi:hypothetical protein